jgi:putative transcriptional regulator
VIADWQPSTINHAYARSPGMASIDFTAIQKLARLFDVMVEDLVEVVED